MPVMRVRSAVVEELVGQGRRTVPLNLCRERFANDARPSSAHLRMEGVQLRRHSRKRAYGRAIRGSRTQSAGSSSARLPGTTMPARSHAGSTATGLVDGGRCRRRHGRVARRREAVSSRPRRRPPWRGFGTVDDGTVIDLGRLGSVGSCSQNKGRAGDLADLDHATHRRLRAHRASARPASPA